jgi:hypothetical protein
MVTATDRILEEQNLDQQRIDTLKINETFDFEQPEIDRSKSEITVQNQKFYLPNDPELREKILDARDDVQTIINEMQKLDKSPTDINYFIDQYLKTNNLTRAQISGKFPEPETDFYMALTQGTNKMIRDRLNYIIDFAYYTSPSLAISEGAQRYVNEKEEIPNFDVVPENEKLKKKVNEVFEFLNFIDPSFTADTFAEMVADNMGGFIIDAIPVSGALTTVTKANKLKVNDPDTLKGIYSKGKNNLKILYNSIVDIYDTAKKEGRLGRVVADDILAAMGFSAGMDVGKKLSEEGASEGPSVLGTPFKLALENFTPFLGAFGFQKTGSMVYDVPINTYNSLKGFIKNFNEFNQNQIEQLAKQKADDYLRENPGDVEGAANVLKQNLENPQTNSITANLIKYYQETKTDKKAKKIAEEIQGQINPDEVAAREESLKLENRLNQVVVQTVKKDANGNDYIAQEIKNLREVDSPSLDFSLAQATENPQLIETQRTIESNLIDGGFKITTPGRSKQKGEVAQNVKDLSLSNYKVVDDALQREFPDKQFVYTTVEGPEGQTQIVAVEQKIGNFNSYFNTNNRVGGIVDQQIDDELTAQTNILTPGATIKAVEGDVGTIGADIRNKYVVEKDRVKNVYDDQLIKLVDDSFGDRNFDITDFKDTVITKIKPDFGTRTQDIPEQFYAIRDLGNDFAPIINNANRALNNAYEEYLSSPTTTNYKTYMEKVKSIEKNLENQINNLNSNLQKKLASGDVAIAPTYNTGEITFTYPGTIKFDNAGKVVAGIDDIGKTYMGRDLKAGEPIGIGVPGSQVTVDITDPTLDIPIKQLIKFKEGVMRDLNLAMQKPNENSELIKKLSIIAKEIDGVVDDNLEGIKAYDDWLTEKKLNYTDIFEKGQINKILTQTGTGEYAIPDELVGKAFLTNPKSIEEFFGTFGGDPEAVKGIEAAFYDMLFNVKGGILNKDGLIDMTKLKNFKANNADMITALDEYIPIANQLDSQIQLGVQAANRLKILNDRKKYADFIELDAYVKNNEFKTGLTYKNTEQMINQVLKDPEQMKDVVNVLKNAEDQTLITSFKNQIFDKFLDSAKGFKLDQPLVKGGTPKVGGMTKFLTKNEDSIKAYYKAMGDPEGYQRLLDITEAYRKLNLTGYPAKLPDAVPDKIQQIFGTGIPQILSRVFAVQSGRTSSRFVSAELGMRFMEKLNTTQREKIIAAALYDKDNATALLKMLEGKSLDMKELNILKGIFGKTYGLIGTSVQDEIESQEQNKEAVPYGFEAIDIPAAENRVQFNPRINQLNIPSVSPASSLAGVNVSGAMTPATTPNTLQKGQALFGANDPIFGGIASVA